jgi:PleD family two-component response regulator
MNDQEIRSKAIELTIQAISLISDDELDTMMKGFKQSGNDTVTYPFIFHCRRFEKYIREGVEDT